MICWKVWGTFFEYHQRAKTEIRIPLIDLGYFKYLFFGRNLTNISVERLSAEEIALLYGARWEIAHLRWAKVFTIHADRLLTEVLECIGLKQDGITLYNIFLDQGCDPNIKRERLMELWVT